MFWGFGHAIWFLLPLFFLGRLFWLIILTVLVVAAIRWLISRGRHIPAYTFGMPPVQPSALEILRQRYARGEIDAVTYEQMRERLENPIAQKQQ